MAWGELAYEFFELGAFFFMRFQHFSPVNDRYNHCQRQNALSADRRRSLTRRRSILSESRADLSENMV